MGISEKKMQIVINNYFKQECDVNTSIREAFEKGFRIGVKKTLSAQPGWIPWNNGELPEESGTYAVTVHDGATKRVTYAKYQKRLKRWELAGSRAYWKVLAWQPMPKPWEGR